MRSAPPLSTAAQMRASAARRSFSMFMRSEERATADNRELPG